MFGLVMLFVPEILPNHVAWLDPPPHRGRFVTSPIYPIVWLSDLM